MFVSITFMHVAMLLVAVVYLTATIWAIVLTVQDANLSTENKVVWVAALVIIPIIALLSWTVARMVIRRRQVPRN